ncbi:MAG: DUF3343 domain-containing protein [Clostridia bacterium]
MDYTATFHTHLAALKSARTLDRAGYSAVLAPVPRAISSSCGTCMRYSADAPLAELMDADIDAIYSREDSGFIKVT